MSDKTVERPAKAGKAQHLREEALDAELRELYEKYGEGNVPQHIVELAKKLDAARREQNPADVEETRPAVPAESDSRE